MKKFAIPTLVALALVISGCGSGPSTTSNTSAGGNWEAQLIGGTGDASLLNFVTAFSVTNSGPLDFTGFSFINAGACFEAGISALSETGTANFTTSSTGAVTGQLTLTVTSSTTGSTLTFVNGSLTGTSSGTTTTNGTLSNGVVAGQWTLANPGNPSCDGQGGTYVMCQGLATCTVP
jgi:hypothetical protein